MIILRYLYYRFYRLWLYSSVSEAAAFIAALLMGVLLSLNLLTGWALLTIHYAVPFPAKATYMAVLLGIFALLSLYLFPRRRYKRIIQQMEDESKRERIIGNIILASYIAFTFASLLVVAFAGKGKL